MAITFINKSRLENNLWVATNGAFSDNLLIDGFLTSGYLAANHNQYWVINGRNRHVDFAYAEIEPSLNNLYKALAQWGAIASFSTLNEEIAVAYINRPGGAATTVIGTGTYSNKNGKINGVRLHRFHNFSASISYYLIFSTTQ